MTYTVGVTVSAADMAWAAGFLEGEGTFYLPRSGSLCVTAGQVQKEPLDRLVRMFGGGMLQQANRTSRSDAATRQPIWRWRLHGQRAAGVMFSLYAIMSPRRREQIRTAIAAWKQRPGKCWLFTTTHCKWGHAYSDHGYTVRVRGRKPKRGCRICSRRRVNDTNARDPLPARLRSKAAYAKKKALRAAAR